MPDSDELIQKKMLGAEKKLWTIELLYDATPETKRYEYINLTADEVMKFRETAFRAGVMLPIAPHRWVVIPPTDIRAIYIERQEKYHER